MLVRMPNIDGLLLPQVSKICVLLNQAKLLIDSMIDFGFVISAFVPLVCVWIFGLDHLRAVWRVSLGLGVVPAVAVFLWRLSKRPYFSMIYLTKKFSGMQEPEVYKRSSMKHAKVPYLLIFRRYWRSLLAVSATWFIYDVITQVVHYLI